MILQKQIALKAFSWLKKFSVSRIPKILNDAIAEMENYYDPTSISFFLLFSFDSYDSNFIYQFYNLGWRRIGPPKIT